MAKNSVYAITLFYDGNIIINRNGQYLEIHEYQMTTASRIRLLRALAGEPVFGHKTGKHPIENYPNSTAWYLDNFDR